MKIVELVAEQGRSTEDYYRRAFEMSGNEVSFEAKPITSRKLSLAEIKELGTGAELVLLAPSVQLSSRNTFEKMPSTVYQADEFDAVELTGERPWPIHFQHLSLRKFIENHVKEVDRLGSALIAGVEIFPSSIALLLAQLGYKKVRLIVSDEFLGKMYLSKWQRAFLSVEWGPQSAEELTQDSGDFSIALCSTYEDQEVLETLYYFNFLQTGGVVIDLRLLSENCDLIKEAKEIKSRAYHGHLMLAHRIDLMFQHYQLNRLNIEEYLKSIRTIGE